MWREGRRRRHRTTAQEVPPPSTTCYRLLLGQRSMFVWCGPTSGFSVLCRGHVVFFQPQQDVFIVELGIKS